VDNSSQVVWWEWWVWINELEYANFFIFVYHKPTAQWCAHVWATNSLGDRHVHVDDVKVRIGVSIVV